LARCVVVTFEWRLSRVLIGDLLAAVFYWSADAPDEFGPVLCKLSLIGPLQTAPEFGQISWQ